MKKKIILSFTILSLAMAIMWGLSKFFSVPETKVVLPTGSCEGAQNSFPPALVWAAHSHSKVHRDVRRKDYVHELQEGFKGFSLGHKFINQAIFKEAVERDLQGGIRKQRAGLLGRFDVNGDSRLTSEEVRNGMENLYWTELKRAEKEYNKVMRLDVNHDGILETKEIVQLYPEEKERIIKLTTRWYKPYAALLSDREIDVDHIGTDVPILFSRKGKLTVKQFIKQGKRVFDGFDDDEDGVLTKPELRCVHNVRHLWGGCF